MLIDNRFFYFHQVINRSNCVFKLTIFCYERYHFFRCIKNNIKKDLIYVGDTLMAMKQEKYETKQQSVMGILGDIENDQIAIPEIQRPFVWQPKQVSELIDSLYKGFPTGYLIIWKNPNVRLKDGTFSNGKKILIDGKEFLLGDVETAIKNIPVSLIQSVKFYDQQSDQARITGIEDGNKETVLDFTMKSGMNHGYMTNLNLGAGTEHRYASRFMGSRFTDKSRFVLLGNLNNKEENAGWWNRRGLNARKMLGTNYNYDDGEKIKLDFSIRWNHRDGDNKSENASENFYSPTSRTFSNSFSKSLTRSDNWSGNIRLEWKPDTLSNILLRANGSTGGSATEDRSS